MGQAATDSPAFAARLLPGDGAKDGSDGGGPEFGLMPWRLNAAEAQGLALSAHKAARSGCKAASLPQAASAFPGFDLGPARGTNISAPSA
jgi:hypothetical protein